METGENKAHGPAIVIADDHPIFRKGLRELIETESAFRVVADVGDGEEAWRAIQVHRPAIAVLDIEMPKASGIEIAQRIQEKDLPVRVIILTMHKIESIFNKALDAGVSGYLLKISAIPDIIDALEQVSKGEYYFSPTLAVHAVRKQRNMDATLEIQSIDALSKTEREVLRMIAAAKSSRDIAEVLHIHYRTVERHRHNICTKLGLSGSYALLRFALENKVD